MATSSRIHVMISSRCNDNYPEDPPGRALSTIRKELKKEIETLEIFGEQIFKVYINEKEAPKSAVRDSWEECIKAVEDCDILIALSNGNAGWANEAGDIGICHAELHRGLSQAPGKVRVVELGNIPITNKPEDKLNKQFQEYVTKQTRSRGGNVSTEDELKTRVKEALRDALVALTQAGVWESSKAAFHSGDSLDWSRMSFQERHDAMCEVLRAAMRGRTGAKLHRRKYPIVHLAGTEILFVPEAIPAAMNVAAAKEMVGQPFLRDHELADDVKGKRGGPVHIIGCHKNATEGQAIKLLGFPDATVVSAPFGIFVADNISKVQFAFIINCRDEAMTRHGVQRFFEWLAQTGEGALVADRASARARIVAAIAKETKV